MKIAIVGSGISGMLAAHLLSEEHDTTVFEANDYIGGHTHTIDVEHKGETYAVDTGFIVFNDWTYPNFIKLLSQLGVESQPTEMSFSVKCAGSGMEYCGTSLGALFAQRGNLASLTFYRMLLDIVRFNRASKTLLSHTGGRFTLKQYLEENGYSSAFVENYIVPMAAAIWSADPVRIGDFPASYFVQFFKNHGLLNLRERPQWRVITGGSKRYIEKLTARFQSSIRLNTPVQSIHRSPCGVEIQTRQGERERFDHVIIAAHSDQALRMLADPSDREREILGAIPYQENETVLHTDDSLLPATRRAWASWNYFVPEGPAQRAMVSYNMNILQGIDAPCSFITTLNRTDEIDPEKIIARLTYHHPVYTQAGFEAQKRWSEISGVNRTHFCGAYWGWGFHEDGVNSALNVCRLFGKSLG
jgi:predicted NAD/FAD-binding protein